MSKFNRPTVRARIGTMPITSVPAPTVLNHQGGAGYARDARSELFVLGISNLVGEKTFYEKGMVRDERFTQLIHAVASDPTNRDWMAGFLPWLRKDANMRSAPVMGALEAAHAMLAAGITGSRQIIAKSMDRADEPGEALAYWITHYGRNIPMPVKRGVADAARRLYTEYGLLKYDTAGKAIRFGDVIELCHLRPNTLWRGDLYRYAIERRHGRTSEIPLSLPMIHKRHALKGVAIEDMDQADIKASGMTWENTISAASPAEKAEAWRKQIPSMGYMALLRNLRNFEQVGLDDSTLAYVAAKIADREAVRRSRQFPFRFLSAKEEVNSLRWAWPLEMALQHSLQNVPELVGNTLILVDCSGSMSMSASEHSSMDMRQIAGLFGGALYLRNHGRASLVAYGNDSRLIPAPAGASLLSMPRLFTNMGGTHTANAITQHLRPEHNRVILITDEQHYGAAPHTVVPAGIPLYVFNLVGYKHASMPTNANRVTIGGGLTDGSFKILSLLEAGRNGTWPWEMDDGEPDGD